MELVETPVFTRQVTHQLEAEDYRALQLTLLTSGDRCNYPRSEGCAIALALTGARERGGARLIYYWNRAQERIFLLFLYPKNVQADLTPSQLRMLRDLIADE
jgi:hypothetical protein